jgi:Domain of Unknown Function (DUF1543)
MSDSHPNNKIYAIYFGGNHTQTNIEVHDLVFGIGPDIESCHQYCVDNWFGEQRPHIDGYVEIEIPNNNTNAGENEYSLFCLNFGGYIPGQLAEMHEIVFVLAKTKGEAITQAKSNLKLKFYDLHLDECLEVDNIIDVSQKVDLKFSSPKDLQFEVFNCYKKL